LALEEKVHPLAIILTQDCDLDWDFKARSDNNLANKLLPNILLCELWLSEQLRGEQNIKSDLWRRIRNNADERYHVLPQAAPEVDLLGLGFPELALDFKRVFTIRADELYFRLNSEAQRRACLQGLFMQDVSTRFGYYQLRVPLPVIEAVPPPTPLIQPADPRPEVPQEQHAV
jgi:hypothetical protein